MKREILAISLLFAASLLLLTAALADTNALIWLARGGLAALALASTLATGVLGGLFER